VIEGSKGKAFESSDGALLEDISISNITMRDIVDAPLFLRLNRRNRGPRETARPGTLRLVAIANIVSHNSAASTALVMSGIAENRIEDVKISHCFFGHQGLPETALQTWGETSKPVPDWRTLQAPSLKTRTLNSCSLGPLHVWGFFARHLKNLEMSHVEIAPANAEPRPAFWLEDVRRADCFAITAPPPSNFELRNVTDFRIGWSRAAKHIALGSAIKHTL
jgi:hypothetical protein